MKNRDLKSKIIKSFDVIFEFGSELSAEFGRKVMNWPQLKYPITECLIQSPNRSRLSLRLSCYVIKIKIGNTLVLNRDH